MFQNPGFSADKVRKKEIIVSRLLEKSCLFRTGQNINLRIRCNDYKAKSHENARIILRNFCTRLTFFGAVFPCLRRRRIFSLTSAAAAVILNFSKQGCRDERLRERELNPLNLLVSTIVGKLLQNLQTNWMLWFLDGESRAFLCASASPF